MIKQWQKSADLSLKSFFLDVETIFCHTFLSSELQLIMFALWQSEISVYKREDAGSARARLAHHISLEGGVTFNNIQSKTLFHLQQTPTKDTLLFLFFK